MPDYEPGFEIAGYRIEEVLGHGGMAVVYRAQDTRLGRNVALKLLTPPLADSQQFRQRFIRESRLAASLDHPNIVPIYEAGEAEGQLFIAMRYVVGSDLKVLLNQQRGPLPLAQTLRLFVQVGDALDAAHQRGLVHRDVKPGNILISAGRERSGHASSDHVYLTDFGLTKRTSELSGGLTGTGHFLGTVDYVSPEQIQGRPVGPGTDVYALGCVLFECLTGQLPFHRDDDAALLWAHLVEMPPPVTGLRPELPPEVNSVVARAMAKAPQDRYASCTELVRDLELALDVAVPLTRPSSHARSGARGEQYAGADSDATSTDSRAPTTASDPAETRGRTQHPSFPPGTYEPFSGAGGPSAEDAVSVPAQRGEEALLDDEAVLDDEAAWDGATDVESVEADPESVEVTEDAESWEEEQAWEEEQPWEETPEPLEEAEVSGAVPAERGGRRRWWLVGAAAAAVAVLALVIGLVLHQTRGTQSFTHYASTNAIIPFALDHPSAWTPQEGTDTAVVISPRNDALGALFLSGAAGDWTRTQALLRTSPSDAVGLYAYSLSAQFGGTSDTALQESVRGLLPANVTFTSTTQQAAPVGGASTSELDGALANPANPSTRLRIVVYVCQPSQGGSVVIAFFAAPDKFDSQQSTFDRVLKSVTW